MKNTISAITEINQTVSGFNTFLSSSHRIPLFDIKQALDTKKLVKIIHGNWDAFSWPENGKRGVYFLFGHEKQTQKPGIYIGKASFGSSTSARLYSHLHRHRKKEFFEMNGYRNEVYILDYMTAIDLDRLGIPFMSSALEEYLINSLKSRLNLINGTGN